MPRAQLDLSDMAAGAVNFLGNQSRTGKASAGLAFGNVAASVNANGRWFWIEIWLKQNPKFAPVKIWMTL